MSLETEGNGSVETETTLVLLRGVRTGALMSGALLEMFALEATGSDSAYFAKRGGALLALSGLSEIIRRLSRKNSLEVEPQESD